MSAPPPGPDPLAALADVEGLDEATRRHLVLGRGVTSVSDLDLLARTNRLRDDPDVGPAVQAKVLAALRRGRGWAGERLLDAARASASRLLGALQREASALRLAVAGSVRRMEPVSDGVDLVATSTDPPALLAAFRDLPFVERVLAQGESWSEVRLEDGTRARLDAFAEDERTLVAMVVRTGPEDYVRALRELAAARGLVLGEAVLHGPSGRIAVGSEEEVFERIGAPWRPPETRSPEKVLTPPPEGLLRMTDVRGVFHVHTRRGHGSHSLAEMAARAAREGYEWIAVTDRARPEGGRPFDADELRTLRDEVLGGPEDSEASEPRAAVLLGCEAAVLPDGSLDAAPGVLEQAEVVVAVVDAPDGEDVTERLRRAVRDPRVHVLGRPQGRVRLGRPGPAVDLAAVLDACAESGTAVEIDGDPHRLDLDPAWHGEARRRGIPAVVGADAHDLVGIDQAILAVGCARRGEWRREEVLATRTAAELRDWCRERRERGRVR